MAPGVAVYPSNALEDVSDRGAAHGIHKCSLHIRLPCHLAYCRDGWVVDKAARIRLLAKHLSNLAHGEGHVSDERRAAMLDPFLY
jgi:hypothetical protein